MNLRNRAGSVVLDQETREKLQRGSALYTASRLARELGTSVTTLEKAIDGIPIRASAADGIRISLAIVFGYRARVPQTPPTVKAKRGTERE